jgi:hypothetical protein
MEMREKALEWLYKELKRTRISIGQAEQRKGVKQEELAALNGKVDVLEYLCGLVTKEDEEDD